MLLTAKAVTNERCGAFAIAATTCLVSCVLRTAEAVMNEKCGATAIAATT